MKRFIIGLDLDDVLCDFISEFVGTANKLFGRPAIDTQPVDWEWSNLGLSKEEQGQVWDVIKAKNDFWVRLQPEEGFDSGTLWAMDAAHEVYFPTARVNTRGNNARKQSSEWLWLTTGIRFPAVIAAYEKGPMALALKYDYFLDDRPKNCMDIHNALPNCKVYLKNSSHNEAFIASEWLVRVKDFNEFAAIVAKDASEE